MQPPAPLPGNTRTSGRRRSIAQEDSSDKVSIRSLGSKQNVDKKYQSVYQNEK